MKKTMSLLLFLSLFNVGFVYAEEWKQDTEYVLREIQFRLAPQFGLLTNLNELVTDYGINSFVLLQPEISVAVQIHNRWFASATFDYGKAGTKISGSSANFYAGTVGVKLVGWEAEPGSTDFFDGSRWWVGLELGDYVTQIAYDPLNFSQTDHDFGFNIGTGFDYFFNENVGAGLQTKMHYVNYSLDDYILFSFGPFLVVRFQ